MSDNDEQSTVLVIEKLFRTEDHMMDDEINSLVATLKDVAIFLDKAYDTLSSFEYLLQNAYNNKLRWNEMAMIRLRTMVECDEFDAMNIMTGNFTIDIETVSDIPLIRKIKQHQGQFKEQSICTAYVNIVRLCFVYMMLYDYIQEVMR